MYSITREYWFSAAHRIEGHPKCGRLHGHNYKVVVEIADIELPEDGMLIDYGRLDTIVKPVIDLMDHRYISSNENRLAGDQYGVLALQCGDVYPLDMPASTAECLAEYLYMQIWGALIVAGHSVNRHNLEITVQETPKSTATFTKE